MATSPSAVERVESLEVSWEGRSAGGSVESRGVATLPLARTEEVVGGILLLK